MKQQLEERIQTSNKGHKARARSLEIWRQLKKADLYRDGGKTRQQ